MPYLKNVWYMAGWADELAANDTKLARRICDVPILLFLNADGTPAAVEDRCPHRFAPLSLGKLQEGSVTCLYHGLRFAGDGRCVYNPHGPITNSMAVRSYPVVQRHRVLWIWMGESALADVGLIPPFHFLELDCETAGSKGYLNGHGNYELYVDNIMDLSHIDFLHADTLGGGSIAESRAKITETERSIIARWEAPGMAPAPLFVKLGVFDPARSYDRVTEVEWFAPGSMRLTISVGPADDMNAARLDSVGVHIMTPETDMTAHYFFAGTRNFLRENASFNAQLAERRDSVFATEDGPMIKAVQSRMHSTDLFAHRPILLRTDEAAIRVRRRLNRLIIEEADFEAETAT